MVHDLAKLRLNDDAKMRATFYRVFDFGRALDAFRRIRSGSWSGSPVGEGTHFRVFRFGTSGEMALALKDAKFAVPDGRDPRRVERWLTAMSRLKALRPSLVPPFEIVRDEEWMACVMPYGESSWDGAGDHWKPLDSRVEELQSVLSAAGLEIDDVIQGRAWSGVPFVCDLSDLRVVERSL